MKEGTAGLAIYIGFSKNNPTPASGKMPLLASKIIVHESYTQEKDQVSHVMIIDIVAVLTYIATFSKTIYLLIYLCTLINAL